MSWNAKVLEFPVEVTSVSPTTTAAIYTQALGFSHVSTVSLFLNSTLNQAISVQMEVTESLDETFISKGNAVNVIANAGRVVLDADDFPKFRNGYAFIRFKITPAVAPTAGSLTGKLYYTL